jgi:hypothetical protein
MIGCAQPISRFCDRALLSRQRRRCSRPRPQHSLQLLNLPHPARIEIRGRDCAVQMSPISNSSQPE